jgi:hypothetical protein
MGIRNWWNKLRKTGEEDALRREEDTEFESPEQRTISSSGRRGLGADERIRAPRSGKSLFPRR